MLANHFQDTNHSIPTPTANADNAELMETLNQYQVQLQCAEQRITELEEERRAYTEPASPKWSKFFKGVAAFFKPVIMIIPKILAVILHYKVEVKRYGLEYKCHPGKKYGKPTTCYAA